MIHGLLHVEVLRHLILVIHRRLHWHGHEWIAAIDLHHLLLVLHLHRIFRLVWLVLFAAGVGRSRLLLHHVRVGHPGHVSHLRLHHHSELRHLVRHAHHWVSVGRHDWIALLAGHLRVMTLHVVRLHLTHHWILHGHGAACVQILRGVELFVFHVCG